MKTLIKLAVLALVIKEIWLLMGVPVIADAVISFVTVGAIPGTNTTISPDDILQVLPFIAIFVIGLIFRKEFVRFFVRAQARKRESMRTFAEEHAYEAHAVRMPIPHPLSAAAGPSRISKVLGKANSQYRVASGYLGLRAQRSRLAGIVVLGSLWIRLRAITYFLWGMLMVGVVVVAQTSIQFWRWLEPHLQEFDRWLNRKSHENELTAFLLALVTEMVATFQGWIATLKAVTSQKDFDPKTRK